MERTQTTIAALACSLLFAPDARAQWQIESKDGKSAVKFGFLAQPQAELLETPDQSETSQNLFIRRFRAIMSGKVAEHWEFFVETDCPNLGRANPDKAANPTGAKDAGTIYIQDLYLTYSHVPAFKVDAGLLLMAQSHNHGQSAASLLPVDYGPYTFMESGPMGERVGRDYGVQLRGYPFGQHLEYRAGVFSGIRGTEATNPLRYAGRVAYYPWASETGLFYGGTFQGSKKLLSLGGSFDVQKSYRSYGGDVFYEQPIHGAQGLTTQFDWVHRDGGEFLASLPEEDSYLFEAAFHVGKGRFSSFVQYAIRDFAEPTRADQNSLQAGLAWWMKGHNRNLKASAGRLHTDGQPDRTQVLAQLQIFYN